MTAGEAAMMAEKIRAEAESRLSVASGEHTQGSVLRQQTSQPGASLSASEC